MGEKVTTDEKSIDQMFDVLGSERRRHLCLYLGEVDEDEFSLGELVEHVVTEGSNVDGEVDDYRDHVRTSLHHVDLPKLADVGLVEYDLRTKTVRCENSALKNFVKARF